MSLKDMFKPPEGVGAISKALRSGGDFGDIALSKPLDVSNSGATVLTFPKTLNDPAFALKTLRIEVLDAVDIYKNCTDAIASWVKEKIDGGEPQGGQEGGGIQDSVIKESKVAYVINLPLPNALQEQNSHSYSEEGDLMANIVKSVNEVSTSLGKAANSANRLMGFTDIKSEISQYTPQLPMLDPLKWQNYTGSALRTFQLAFKFAPRSVDEANDMFRIVYILKRASYPVRFAGGNALIPPSRIRLKYKNPILHKLINPNICVVDSVGTVYETGDDVATTLDGVPRKMELTLSLKEFRQKYADDWDIDGESDS